MKLSRSFLIKLFVNPANWFLIFIITLTLLNCWLVLESSTAKSIRDSRLIIRPLAAHKSDFGQLKYSVLYQRSVWELSSPKALLIGQPVMVQGSLLTYGLQDTSEDKFANYALSLGVVGEIKVESIVAIDSNCDWICLIIKQFDQTQYNIGRIYQQSYCGNKWIPQFLTLENDCQNVYGLSVGLVLGGSGEFTKNMKQNFRSLGLSHLVAVSGFQVILVATIVESLLKRSGIGRRAQVVGIVLFVFCLIGLVGPQPPVLRSSLSLIISLICLTGFGRQLSLTRSLIYSAIVMLVLNPFYIISISFLLSFAASFGLSILPSGINNERIIHVKNQAKGFWHQIWTALRELGVSTGSAFAFTLPIILGLNPTNSLIGIVLNILIIPIIPILTGLNILGLIPVLGEFLLIVTNLAQSLLLLLIQEIAKIAPSFYIGQFEFWEIGIFYMILVLVSFWTRLWQKYNGDLVVRSSKYILK